MAERHVSGARLSAFLDDELDEAQALVATRHLAGCERCLAELSALRATRDALRRLPLLQAPVLTSGIEARARQMADWSRRLRVAVVVATVPLVLGLGAYLLGGEAGDVEPATDTFLAEHLAKTSRGAVPTAGGGGGG